MSIDSDFVYLCGVRQAFSFQPLEALTGLDISRYQKKCDGYLQLTRELKGIRLVIALLIIEAQHQGDAPVSPSLARHGRRIEFLQSIFQMHDAIVTAQIEQLVTQGVTSCTMIVHDNEAWSSTLHPPVGEFHQTTVVETCCNDEPHTLSHRLPLPYIQAYLTAGRRMRSRATFLATAAATRGAAALQPTTKRYSGPKLLSELSPTKYSPGTLLSNHALSIGSSLLVLISVSNEGCNMVRRRISTL